MHVLEGRVIRCHAVVLKVLDDCHAVIGFVLLGQSNGDLLGTVVAEVEEDHHVTLLDATVNCCVDDGFDELVGHAFVIRFLNGFHHVVALLASACGQHVVGHLDAVPVVVAVHGIVATDNGGHDASALLAVFHYLTNESLAALGVGVTTIHETMNKHLLQAIFLSNVAQGHQVLL